MSRCLYDWANIECIIAYELQLLASFLCHTIQHSSPRHFTTKPSIVMAPIGLSFLTLLIIIAFIVLIFQYLKNQWLRYRNPFHDFIMFFKSCCSRGEIVNRERSISQQNTHVPPIVTDGVLSRANDKEFRRFLVLKYIIQKIGAWFDWFDVQRSGCFNFLLIYFSYCIG